VLTLLILEECANTQEPSHTASLSVLWTFVDLSYAFKFVWLCFTRAKSPPLNVCIGTRSILCPTHRDSNHAVVMTVHAGCVNIFLALAARAPAQIRAQSEPARRRLWDVLRKLLCTCKDARPVRARALERHTREPAAQADLVPSLWPASPHSPQPCHWGHGREL
jgi:hypothetical protein